MTSPASIVLPRPTSSASSSRSGFGRHGAIEDGELVGQRIDAAPGDRERFAARHGDRHASPVAARQTTSSGSPRPIAMRSEVEAGTRSSRPVDGTTTVATDSPQSSSVARIVTGFPRAQPTRRLSMSARELFGVVEVEEQPLVLGERLGREPLADGDDRREVAALPRIGEAGANGSEAEVLQRHPCRRRRWRTP